jgi:hypothetical protein
MRAKAGRFDLSQRRKPLFALNWVGTKANRVMYTFLKILIVVVLALVLIDLDRGPTSKELDQYTQRPCWMGFSFK